MWRRVGYCSSSRVVEEISLTRRKEKPLSLAMVDVDDFKRINDIHGHQSGDKVLSEIGGIINHGIRDMDIAARYGGEELVILMPDTNIETAYDVADRIRGDIEKTIGLRTLPANKPKTFLTIS